MKHQDELLNKAIQAVRDDEPGSEAIHASATRISDRLGVSMRTDSAVEQIRGCEDVRRLLPAYREGTLPGARALLVKAHLGECGTCLRYFREGSQAVTVDWSVPARKGGTVRRAGAHPTRAPRTLGWGLAFSFALAVCLAFLYKAYWEVPTGVRAEVQSIDGIAWLISDGKDRKLAPGASHRRRRPAAHFRRIAGSDSPLGRVDGRSE